MSEWNSETIGKLCEVLDYKRRPISKVNRKAGPYPYYGATGIQDYIDDFLFDEPLILVGEDGAKWGSCQTCALRVEGRYWVNNHAHVIKPNREIICDSWLVNYLNFADLNESVTGTTVQKLNQANLRDIRVPLPEIKIQKRIAAELDRRLTLIAEAREAAERRLAAAEELEGALFREVFGGAVPVSIGYGEGVFNSFAQPKPVPQSSAKEFKTPSPYCRLSEVARLESGHTPSRRRPEWWGGEIPWIALPDIRALDGKVAMETIRNTNPEGIANSSARILPKDTVIFGRDVQVGFTTIAGRPMATSQHFFNWICGEDLNPRYLMHALRASREYLKSMSSGAIHQTIYMPAAKDFHILLPPRKTQDAIAADLDKRLTQTTTILQSARTALETIKALPAAALREIFG